MQNSTGDSTTTMTKGDAVEKKPVVEVGHKRKASRDISLCESISTHFKELHSGPISPSTGQQLNDQMMPQEKCGEVNEKVEGNKGIHIERLQGLNLNQRTEERGNSSDHAEETKVEPFVATKLGMKLFVVEEIEVEPYAAENKGENPFVVEKTEVEPNAMEKNEVEPSVIEINEVEHSAMEKKEVKPSAVDTIEVEPYPIEEHTVMHSTTKAFKFDLNELPSEEDEDYT